MSSTSSASSAAGVLKSHVGDKSTSVSPDSARAHHVTDKAIGVAVSSAPNAMATMLKEAVHGKHDLPVHKGDMPWATLRLGLGLVLIPASIDPDITNNLNRFGTDMKTPCRVHTMPKTIAVLDDHGRFRTVLPHLHIDPFGPGSHMVFIAYNITRLMTLAVLHDTLRSENHASYNKVP